MAIKFSQFITQTSASSLSHIVGYNGADNIQITPADFFTSFAVGSAGQVSFFDTTSSLAGSNEFVWDNTNKRLGIGTSSPGIKLDVNSGTTNNVARFQSTDSVARIILKDNTGEAHLSASGDDMLFATSSSGSERMRITDTGNVGIGTTSPSSKLQVSGTLDATGISQLGSSGANVFLTSSSAGNVGIGTSSPGSKLTISGTNNGSSEITLINTNPSTDNDWSITPFYNDQSLRFRTNSATTTVMTLKDNGNVGIGTSSPATFLQVSGQGNRAGGNIQMGFSSQGADKWSYLTGTHYNSTTEPEGFALIGGYSDIDENRVVIGGDVWETNPATSIHFWTHNSSTHAQGGTQRMVINSVGNVGIGTTSPVSKLQVAGNIHISSATGPILTLTDTDTTIGAGSRIAHIAFVGSEIGGETSRIACVSETSGGEGGLKFYTGASVTQALELDISQNATFAGNISTSSSSSTIGTPRIIMEADGTLDWGASKNIGTLTWDSDYAYLKGQVNKGVKIQVNNNTTALTFETNANAAFEGTLIIPNYIYHASDPGTDTYFGFNGNDNFTVVTAGGNGLVIDSNRDVTLTGSLTIPRYLQHAGDSDTYFEFSAANNIKLVAGAKTYLHAHDNGNLYLYSNNSTALTLDSSQNATFAGFVKAPFFTTDGGRGFKQNSVAFVGTYSNGSAANGANDLGSTTNKWRDIYISGDITSSAGGATFADAINTTGKVNINIPSEGNYFEGGSASLRRLTITTGTNISPHALHTFNIASSNGKYKFDVNGTEQFSIDSSNATFAGNITVSTASATLNLLSGTNGNSTINFADPADNNVGQIIYRHNGNSMAFDTNDVERMRINATGDILFGTTSETNSHAYFSAESNSRMVLSLGAATASASTIASFKNSNGAVGSISVGGSATAFNTSSDYRLKEDLKDFDGLDKVSKIPVYDFKWKVDDSRSYGVMAHELQEVLPSAVKGEKDGEKMQGVDYSKIVPLLIKSIQELKAEVEDLKSKI